MSALQTITDQVNEIREKLRAKQFLSPAQRAVYHNRKRKLLAVIRMIKQYNQNHLTPTA